MQLQPFKEETFNYLEMFNEMCVLFAGYHLIVFTEFVAEVDSKNMAGWSIIVLTMGHSNG